MIGILRAAAVVVSALAVVGAANSANAAVVQRGKQVVVVALSPSDGQTVGIGAPVTVQFSGPVLDRQAAQERVTIDAGVAVPGRFVWPSANVLAWEPRAFWPAHTPVTVTADTLSTTFEVGAAIISVADIDAHTFSVSIDGQVAREMPASLGKPGFDTPVGSFAVLEKQRRVTFDSRTIGIPLDDKEGYLIQGEYGVRVTWGGVYVHSAPWSVASRGKTNVSHGCINLSPDNAAWYFDTIRIGDPVIVQR